MSVISVKKLTKSYGRKPALKGVTFNVHQGQIFGFLGPNGAGKSTTIRILMNYIEADGGEVQIFGKDVRRHSAELKNDIGFLSSDLQLYMNWTGKEHLDLIEGVRGEDPKLQQLTKELELDLTKRVKQLSTGNKQKLAIILAFAGNPKLIIMDEPTRGLDPLLQNKLYELLEEFAAKGGTVFFSSHNLAEVQRLCDAVLVIRTGEVVASRSMDELRDLHIHLVNAVARKPFDQQAFKLDGVEVLHQAGETVALKVRGNINPVLDVLSGYELVDLEVQHANLEEVFMEFYT
jgi:ABC-2 type transport system ATP-binding protein